MSAFSDAIKKVLKARDANPYTVVNWVKNRVGESMSAQFIYDWKNDVKEPADIKYVRWFADACRVQRVPIINASTKLEVTLNDIEHDRISGFPDPTAQEQDPSPALSDDPMLALLSDLGIASRKPRLSNLGSIPAGTPEEREAVRRAYFEGPFDYELTVKGNSLIEIYIEDGDVVTIQTDRPARVNDIVVATVNGENVLRLLAARSENGETVYSLKPANGKYQEIKAGEITIQGVVDMEKMRKIIEARKEIERLKKENESLKSARG